MDRYVYNLNLSTIKHMFMDFFTVSLYANEYIELIHEKNY